LAKHAGPMSSSPLQITLLPIKKIEKKTKLEDIGIKLASEAKCFHKKIMAYNPCRCTTPNP
jgi:hypothetical protein